MALAGTILSARQISRVINVSPRRVTAVLQSLRNANRLRNLGTATRPLWLLRVGDHGSANELRDAVRLLISKLPMTVAALVDATGARAQRIRAALEEIEASGALFVVIADDDAPTRFLVLKAARSAKLPVQGSAPSSPKSRTPRDN